MADRPARGLGADLLLDVRQADLDGWRRGPLPGSGSCRGDWTWASGYPSAGSDPGDADTRRLCLLPCRVARAFWRASVAGAIAKRDPGHTDDVALCSFHLEGESGERNMAVYCCRARSLPRVPVDPLVVRAQRHPVSPARSCVFVPGRPERAVGKTRTCLCNPRGVAGSHQHAGPPGWLGAHCRGVRSLPG